MQGVRLRRHVRRGVATLSAFARQGGPGGRAGAANGDEVMVMSMERTVPCGDCGKPAKLFFGEGGRGWYESFHCPACDSTYEADGGTPMPEEYRQAVIAQEGEWALEATAVPSVALLKALREVLPLSLAETLELKHRMPGEVRRGTRYEMEKLLLSLGPSAGPGTLLVRRAVR